MATQRARAATSAQVFLILEKTLLIWASWGCAAKPSCGADARHAGHSSVGRGPDLARLLLLSIRLPELAIELLETACDDRIAGIAHEPQAKPDIMNRREQLRGG